VHAGRGLRLRHHSGDHQAQNKNAKHAIPPHNSRTARL
jgi:hypothetical protein